MNRQYSSDDIDGALKKAGAVMQNNASAFLIGGCAMTFLALKPSTKDADLLFEDELQEQRLCNALRQTGFEELFPGSYEVPLKAKDILVNEQGLQFDLFARQVMGGLKLSKAMRHRAQKHAQYGRLSAFIASKEDIYLFKAITSRPFPRDFEDLVTLQQSGLDWKAIQSEYEAQVKGNPIEKNLREKMGKLKQAGITNPLQRQLGKK